MTPVVLPVPEEIVLGAGMYQYMPQSDLQSPFWDMLLLEAGLSLPVQHHFPPVSVFTVFPTCFSKAPQTIEPVPSGIKSTAKDRTFSGHHETEI